MVRSFVKKNSSLLLAAGAGVGVLTTAYLSARAGYQSCEVILRDEIRNGIADDTKERFKHRARLTWRFYIPPAAAATATIVCLAGVKRVDASKTLAAQAALAVSQGAYDSYREKVIEEFGEKRDQLILSKVAEDRVSEKPPPAIVAGSGAFLCCEAFTGRYFNSDMDTLNRALNDLNAKLVRHDYATLDDFYYLIHLDTTTCSGQTGWTSSRLVELEFSSILHDNRPVLVFDYNYVTTL